MAKDSDSAVVDEFLRFLLADFPDFRLTSSVSRLDPCLTDNWGELPEYSELTVYHKYLRDGFTVGEGAFHNTSSTDFSPVVKIENLKRENDRLLAESSHLREIQRLTAEKSHLNGEIEMSRAEKSHLNWEIVNVKAVFIDEIRRLEEVNVRFSAENKVIRNDKELLVNENRVLKEENEKLGTENGQLALRIRELIGKGQLPERVLQTEESYNFQSKSQGDHTSVNQQFDDLEMNDVSMSEADECISQETESFQTDLGYAPMALREFLEAEITGNVELSEFSGLEGDRIEVGGYSFPLPLIPVVEKIINSHGNVSPQVHGNVTVNHTTLETAFVLLCAAIKEMEDLNPEEVTEAKMQKWRDVIKDALRLNFKVSFAMEQLKKIGSAYFESKSVKILESKISRLEEELKYYKMKHEVINRFHQRSI